MGSVSQYLVALCVIFSMPWLLPALSAIPKIEQDLQKIATNLTPPLHTETVVSKLPPEVCDTLGAALEKMPEKKGKAK